MTDSVISHIIKANGGNFKPDEFLKQRQRLDRDIIVELVKWRNWHGYSTQITSAFRDAGSHTTGKAIDVLLWSIWKKEQPSVNEIWQLATTWPFLGVGIYFDWDDGIGLHLDVISIERQRPLRWMRVEGEYFYQSLKDGLFYAKDGRCKTIQQFF